MKKRISFWIPEEYRWLYSAIEEVQRRADEKGVRLSQADVILSCVIPILKEYAVQGEKKKIKIKKTKRKRNVSCHRDDSWLFETIDRIVKSKQDLGLNTSFSYELVRLAKNGYIANAISGEKIC